MRSPTSRASKLFSLFLFLIAFLILFALRPTYTSRLSVSEDHSKNWNLKQAEESLATLVADYPDSLEARRLYASTLLMRGELYNAHAEFLVLLDGSSPGELSDNLNLAFTFFHLGNLDSAEFLAREILSHPKATAEESYTGRCFNLLGLIAFTRAQYDSAMENQERSATIARRANDPQGEADALRQIGVLYWYAGMKDSVVSAYYDSALTLYRQVDDKIGEATTLDNMGFIVRETLAMRHHLAAFAIRKKIGDKRGLADSYYHVTLGIPFDSRWKGLSYKYRLRSLELSTAIGYAWGKEVAARSLDHVRFDMQGLPESFGSFAEAEVEVSGEGRIYSLTWKAHKLASSGNWQEASKVFATVVHLRDSLNYLIGMDASLMDYAGSLIMMQEYERAERILHRKDIANWGTYRNRFLVRIALETNRTSVAESLLTSLADQYDAEYEKHLISQSPGLSFYNSVMDLSKARRDTYTQLVELLANQNKMDEAFCYLERARTLPFWGQRQLSMRLPHGLDEEQFWTNYVRLLEKVENNPEDFSSIEKLATKFAKADQRSAKTPVLPPAATPMAQMQSATLNEVQQSLGPREVLIEYFLGEKSVYAFAVRAETASLQKLDISPVELNSLADVFRGAILRGKESQNDTMWMGPAKFLYNSLVAPIVQSGMLQPDDRINIIPDGGLQFVPFQSLISRDGDGSETSLIEEHSMSYLPSASLFVDRRRPVRSAKSLLAILPDNTSLPFAEEEVNNIVSFYYGAKLLASTDASADAILNAIGGFDIIHIAAHGKINERYPLNSYILSADRSLELNEIARLQINPRLVLLSACETGYVVGNIGDIRTGHDVVSFPTFFLVAGAEAVIAPFWLVEDRATSQLVSMFYRNLHTHPGLAKALAVSQRQFIASGRSNGQMPHPFYWSAFSLTGDGR